MLSFPKEAVVGLQPQASLLAGTIASSAPPAAASSSSGGDAARSSRADSAAAAFCGVTSQRSVFTVAQVVAAVLVEAYPLGEAPTTDAERAAAAAALVDRFDLRVCDDDGSVDPDFPPIDSRRVRRQGHAARAGGPARPAWAADGGAVLRRPTQ